MRFLKLLVVLASLIPCSGIAPPSFALQAEKPSAALPRVASAGEETLVIVVNKANPVENFKFDDLVRLFMAEQSHWPNGNRVTLVMHEIGRPERHAVLQSIYGMNEREFRSYFLNASILGKVASPPKVLATPAGVRRFIFNVPGAIGYLRLSDVDSSVKIVRVDSRAPGEPGYRMKCKCAE